MDHVKEWKSWEDAMAVIVNTVNNIKGVSQNVFIPEIANHTPTLHLSWDANLIKLTGKQLKDNLWNGNPGIEVRGGGTMGGKRDGIELSVWQLKPGQEKVIAQRLKEELLKASV
jgi:L-seryl-tRNA(Ser) seleniumtransferase